jgi:hypothetical protein
MYLYLNIFSVTELLVYFIITMLLSFIYDIYMEYHEMFPYMYFKHATLVIGVKMYFRISKGKPFLLLAYFKLFFTILTTFTISE